MPPRASDPYLYPGTQTLRNRLGIRDPAALARAQDDLAAQRYAAVVASPPAGPFTFDLLKELHRRLFGDVYKWAGVPRTIGIGKADWERPGSRMTWFAEPADIPALAEAAFGRIDAGCALMGVDGPTFAARAAAFLGDLNMVHPFREGKGRAQRLLLAAMGQAAGHPIAFEATTRERMLATSVSASRGDVGGFARLLAEAMDPRRVDALGKALGFLRDSGVSWWNDRYVATTTAGQSYAGVLVGRAGSDFMMRVTAEPDDWIAVGHTADLPGDTGPDRRIHFTASRFP